MKYQKYKLTALAALLVLGGSASLSSLAGAETSTTTTTTNSTDTSKTTTQQQHLQNIITKGDQEITRRLTSLATLTSKINAATHLTASDKTTLSNEVASTISGLNTLKTKLDSETTVAAAAVDAQDIYTNYRVYALVTPKVNLIKVADSQQAVQEKLTALAQKLQTRITAEQKAGKDVTSVQSQLTDLTSKVTAAQAISSSVESKVITLQPSDYNSDHAVLSGYNTQLKTARSDDQAAYADAKSIIAALKTM